MAIYKLSEVTNSIRGNSSFQKKDLTSNGEFLALHYGKTYKVNFIDDSFDFYVGNEFYKEDQVVGLGDVLMVSTSETIEDLGHSYYYNSKKMALLGGEQISLKPIKEIVEPKWLYYWLKINKSEFQRFATGLSVFRFKMKDFRFIELDIPQIDEQRKIIDIIEPIETLESTINSTIKKIKLILKHNYELMVGDGVSFYSKIKLINSKYNNQNKYVATNAINEFGLDAEKIQSLDMKIPSRANVSPIANSFIISKLDGENKIFYFNEKPNEVYSTGFFNFETNYVDHVSGFLLSNSFIKQKEMYSTGTTMRGLNNKSLETIKIKNTSNESNELTKYLTNLNDLQSKLIKIKNETIKLLIK